MNFSSLHCPSQDLSNYALPWDDHSPTDSCLPGEPWVHRFDDGIWSGDLDEIVAGNGKPVSDSQLPTSESEGPIFSDILTPSPSNWGPGVDEGEFTPCDVSPFLVSEPWIKILPLSLAAREILISCQSQV